MAFYSRLSDTISLFPHRYISMLQFNRVGVNDLQRFPLNHWINVTAPDKTEWYIRQLQQLNIHLNLITFKRWKQIGLYVVHLIWKVILKYTLVTKNIYKNYNNSASLNESNDADRRLSEAAVCDSRGNEHGIYIKKCLCIFTCHACVLHTLTLSKTEAREDWAMLDALLLQPTGRWNKLEDARADVLIPKVKKNKNKKSLYFFLHYGWNESGWWWFGGRGAAGDYSRGVFCVCQPAEVAQIRHFG